MRGPAPPRLGKVDRPCLPGRSSARGPPRLSGAAPGRTLIGQTTGSDDPDVLGLRAFLTAGDLELDPLVFLQRPVTAGLDGGEVHEHVVATPILSDKPEALVCVEPLHRALRHSHSPARRTPNRNLGPG